MEKGRIKQGLGLAWQGINHLLWPALCMGCRHPIYHSHDRLCADCWSDLLSCVGADYCGRCGKEVSGFALIEGACPDCLGAESDLDGIARAGIYSGSLRKMILALKFKGRSELDSVLGELIDTAQAASELCQRCEIFVPVPMHWSRRLVRGENHAELLAKRIKAARGKIGGGLVRARRTQKQSELKGAASRKRNVAGAFCVRKGHKFKGRRICLVDDIKTSGATLNECARVLKEAGATEVYGLVAAVAGQEAG